PSSMVPGVETRRIQYRDTIEKLSRLDVFDCEGIQRELEIFQCILRPAILPVVILGKLQSVHVATRELRYFGFCFVGCLLKIVEGEPMPFRAEIINNAVIRA